ncbi:MAG: hypothetical protein HYT76_01925 [Deltaproteobacteria bacterium]|nr:hypothetical protein [Deltaproteobacteria bacterium]
MQLTREEFKRRIEEKRLAIAFIGMSNIGKSYRARQLKEEKRFDLLSVDSEIEKILGLEGIEAVAHWMGFPHERRYPKAERDYLEAEAQVMGQLKPPRKKNFILDTTGSVIYLTPETLGLLKENFFVVHFAVDATMIQEMTEKFFAHPKPVIWGGMFQQKPKESLEVAFRRCYSDWLKFRLTKYHELADLSISGKISTDSKISIDQFLEAIQEKLFASGDAPISRKSD